MATAGQSFVDVSKPATFPIHLSNGPPVTTVTLDNFDHGLDERTIARDGDDFFLSMKQSSNCQDRKGKLHVHQSSAVLSWSSSEQRFDLRPLESEYTFAAEAGDPTDEVKGIDDGPDPNNPYDYRHYLDRPITNGTHSPALSAMSTPMHASTPYGSSPLILPLDTEARPGSSRRPPASQRHAQGARKPLARPAIDPPQRISNQPLSTGLIVEDESKRSRKRQRLDATRDGESTPVSRTASTPRDTHEVQSPPLDTGDLDSESGSRHQDDANDADDDVDEFELPAPASGRPSSIQRRKSVLDAEELEALYNAFEEEPATEAHDHEVIVSESESEEE